MKPKNGRVEYESEYCAFNFEKVGKVDPFDAMHRVCGGATRRSASLLDRTEYCDYCRSVHDAVVLARHLRQGQAVTGLIDSITSLEAVKARWMSGGILLCSRVERAQWSERAFHSLFHVAVFVCHQAGGCHPLEPSPHFRVITP